MSSWPRRFALLPWGVLAVAAASFAQQSQVPILRTRADLVRIDVAVLDRSGRPVAGLTQNDFTVVEDGVLQAISTFIAESPLDQDRIVTADAVTQPARGRAFLIVFGSHNMSGAVDHIAGATRPFEGVIGFLRNSLRATDVAAVMAVGRVTALTHDRELLAEVVRRLEHPPREFLSSYLRDRQRGVDLSTETDMAIDRWLAPPSAPAGFLRRAATLLVGTQEYRLNEQITRWNTWLIGFDSLKIAAGIELLRHREGEKHLVLIDNYGLSIPVKYINEGRGMRADSREDDFALAARLSDAEVALDVILTSGTTSTYFPRISSAHLAEHSGGLFTSLRTVDDQLRRVDEATRQGYVIGYSSTNPVLDGKTRSVTIKVNRPNVTVVHRRSYTARAEPLAMDPRAEIARIRLREAAAADMPLQDIAVQASGVNLSGESGKPQARIDMRIDPRSLGLIDRNGTRQSIIDTLITCGDQNQNVVGRLEQRTTVTLDLERFKEALQKGILQTVLLPVSRPCRYVKIVLFEFDSDRIGVATARIQ